MGVSRTLAMILHCVPSIHHEAGGHPMTPRGISPSREGGDDNPQPRIVCDCIGQPSRIGWSESECDVAWKCSIGGCKRCNVLKGIPERCSGRVFWGGGALDSHVSLFPPTWGGNLHGYGATTGHIMHSVNEGDEEGSSYMGQHSRHRQKRGWTGASGRSRRSSSVSSHLRLPG
eukprot:1182487-Prorocentrum_minimum.AAC.7